MEFVVSHPDHYRAAFFTNPNVYGSPGEFLEKESLSGYAPEPVADVTVSAPGADGAAQRFVSGQDIPGQWWTLFRSEALDCLIRKALRDSPTISAARARLREAEENLRARGGTVYSPSLDGSFSANRQKATGASYGQPDAGANTFTLFNASVNVSYNLDIFGGNRDPGGRGLIRGKNHLELFPSRNSR